LKNSEKEKNAVRSEIECGGSNPPSSPIDLKMPSLFPQKNEESLENCNKQTFFPNIKNLKDTFHVSETQADGSLHKL